MSRNLIAILRGLRPEEALGVGAALRAVLPVSTQVFAVGGVGPDNFADWFTAGANGFGLGSSLYQPGMSAAEVGKKAKHIVLAYDQSIKE